MFVKFPEIFVPKDVLGLGVMFHAVVIMLVHLITSVNLEFQLTLVIGKVDMLKIRGRNHEQYLGHS